MNGEEFYEAFKDALARTGVGWREKGDVKVEGKIEISCSQGAVKTTVTIDTKNYGAD